MKARYTRLYSNADGESHFEDIEADLVATDFAPPAPPLNLSSFLPATQIAFFGAPAGWQGDWHPASARNLFIVISGNWEVEASDRAIRQFAPKDVLPVEDTIGKGHRSAVVGANESLSIVVQLAS